VASAWLSGRNQDTIEVRIREVQAVQQYPLRERMKNQKSIYAGPPQPEFKLDEARRAEGRTVEWIDFGFEKRIRSAHGAEGMVIHFTDGSRLQLVVGSNASNIGVADELDTDIMVFFREAGQKD
jgi:hypothetical protein